MDHFTDEDIQFLRDNVSEQHARAAQWFADGMPGIQKRVPPGGGLSQADSEQIVASADAAGARATGMSPTDLHATAVDALSIIGWKRTGADQHPGKPYFEDAMEWRSAPEAEKPALEAAFAEKYGHGSDTRMR